MRAMRVTREVVLDCPEDEVREMLTDPGELADWLGRTVDFEIDIAGDGRVSFVWSDGARPPSRVEFTLEAVPTGTRLTVTETVPARASVAGGVHRLPIGAQWDDRLLDLELRCLTRAMARV